jgi:hypothetical protein
VARRRPSAEELERNAREELGRIRELSQTRVEVLLQTGEARRSSLDQMMWQVPALSLTAQSFLLTIALGHDTRWVGRVLAALLGLIAALAAIQLLLKHRYHELLYSHWLDRFEDELGLPNLHSLPESIPFAFGGRDHEWHYKRTRRTDEADEAARSRTEPNPTSGLERAFRTAWRYTGHLVWRWLGRRAHNTRRVLVPFRSPHVWIWSLALFAVADSVVIGAWVVHVFCHRFNAFG